ncbi:MAG: GIY-YIG nuclease family protein [bacterium]|nr:GIY-YIG nuclease family protein [bacterium]
MLSITKKLAKLPASPGVYLFKNKAGEIIYIGKSGNLKNRVKSYFSSFAKASEDKHKGVKFFNPAKVKMLAEITDIEILRTDSEIAALIKESELIKKHKPKFNVLMRDSKNYLYVAITHSTGSGQAKEEFPKIIPLHQPNSYKLKTKSCLGPFTDGTAVRKTLHILRDIFPYCTCKQKHETKCLNAHMGRCLTFCCLKSTNLARASDRRLMLNEYKKNIRAIKSVLSGRSQVLLKEFKKEIKQVIKNQNFELAKTIKNQITNLDSVLKHTKVLTEKFEFASPSIFKDDKSDFTLLGFKENPKRLETFDVSNFQGAEAVGSMVVFELQENGEYKSNKNEYRKFKIKTVHGINDPAMIAEIIKRRLNNNWTLPQLIIVDGGRTQLNAALEILSPTKIRVVSLAKKLEEIYLPENKEPILAQKFGRSLKYLFQSIRDEAHRFAINYHRKLHRKAISK